MNVKRTRNRPIKSCLECNRRKQKCDRQTPCHHCISRGVADRCVYREPQAKPFVNHTSSRRPASHESDESSDSDSFDPEVSTELGYTEYGSGAFREIEKTESLQPPKAKSSSRVGPPLLHRSIIQQLLPSKLVMDNLIRVFFKEVNWVYEMVYEPVFMLNYELWWSQSDDNNVDISNIDFALLILRLCILSAHLLSETSNSSITSGDVLTEHPQSPTKLEKRLCRVAADVESQRPQKHSMFVVQHMFFRVCYLKNKGRIKNSWFVLADAVKEAHEIGLHLEKPPGSNVSELDRELRRRAFWNLYVWDRFMCMFFGRWPLIPEDYCDVNLPHDDIQAITTSPVVLTQFTDRLFHIHVAQFISTAMGPSARKMNQYDPATVSLNVERFENDILKGLPRIYSLTDTDTSWDVAFPGLALKRGSLHMALNSAAAGLYRGFANPWDSTIPKGNMGEVSDRVISHYKHLLMELCNVLDSAMRLYEMRHTNNLTEGFFMIPMAIIEALSQIGLCFMATQSWVAAKWATQNIERAREIDSQWRVEVSEKFRAAYAVLEQQSKKSRIAKQGIKLLSKLALQIRSYYDSEQSVFKSDSQSQQQSTLATSSPTPSSCENIDQAFNFPADLSGMQDGFFDWLQFATLPDRSWFFEDQNDLFSDNLY